MTDIPEKISDLASQSMKLGFAMGSTALKADLMTRLQPYLEHLDEELLTSRDILRMVFDEISEFDPDTKYTQYIKEVK